jgi:hypothetical protein
VTRTRPRTSTRTGVRSALAAVVAVASLLVTSPPARAQVAATSAPGSATLAGQTPWVTAPGSDFTMRVHLVRPKGPSNLELAITPYSSVNTRSDFSLTLQSRPTGPALAPPQVLPLASLTPDGNGDVTVAVRLQDPALPRDTSRLFLVREGVYPVRVDLRERGTAHLLSRFTTHLVYLPVSHPGAKLGMAMVLPLHAEPGTTPGNRAMPDVDQLTTLVASLDALRPTPVALAPTPQTLTALAASGDERGAAILRTLQQRAPGMTVLGGTFVPTNLPALLAAGLQTDAAAQVGRGASAVAETLHVRPEGRTWLADEPLDDAAVSLLGPRGVDRLVATESDLRPDPEQKLTPTQPFVVNAAGRQIQAVAADAGLTDHFNDPANPVLSAYHLLADLAVVYLDQPGADRRAVVAVAPRSWRPDRSFLETVGAGLVQSPIAEGMPLDAVFTTVNLARTDAGEPLVRRLVPFSGAGLSDVANDLRTARRRVDALGSVLGTGTASHGQLEERLLMAESSELRSNRQRQSYIDAVERAIDTDLRDIRMPQGRSITLTARQAEIPVTFQNRTGVPAKVVVKVQSDKLAFPSGSTHVVDLARRNTTERFAVVSRTSGAFPMRVTLESPDGNLVIGRTRLTIHSTAASSVSLAVSLGAAGFLAVWWGRHALRGRRARRLVPA